MAETAEISCPPIDKLNETCTSLRVISIMQILCISAVFVLILLKNKSNQNTIVKAVIGLLILNTLFLIALCVLAPLYLVFVFELSGNDVGKIEGFRNRRDEVDYNLDASSYLIFYSTAISLIMTIYTITMYLNNNSKSIIAVTKNILFKKLKLI